MKELNGIFTDKLKLLYEDRQSNISAWEHRTLNIHRVVLHYRLSNGTMKHREIDDIVRKEIEGNFKVSWWRGLGFAVLMEDVVIGDHVDELIKYIDDIENPKGTWQWLITKDAINKKIIGMHTWAAGYLTTAFIDAIQYYERKGDYGIETYKRPKGKLMRILTAMSESRMRVPEFIIPK
jgi:hypothetical protein